MVKSWRKIARGKQRVSEREGTNEGEREGERESARLRLRSGGSVSLTCNLLATHISKSLTGIILWRTNCRRDEPVTSDLRTSTSSSSQQEIIAAPQTKTVHDALQVLPHNFSNKKERTISTTTNSTNPTPSQN